MIEGYWEDELPKVLKGQTTLLRQQIVWGSEQEIFLSLLLILFQVFEPSTFEDSKGKLELKAAMKVKYDA